MIRVHDHSLRRGIERLTIRRALTAALSIAVIGSSVLMTQPVGAQAEATLVGRAILPAAQLIDGPASGSALTKSAKTINGIDFPMTSQPVGDVSGLWPGQYGSWLLLTGMAFDNRQASSDVLLRLYIAQIDWRTDTGNGGGQVTVVDWFTFNDSLNKLTTTLVNPGGDARTFTGADFNPRGIATADKGKTWWIADANIPALLHVNSKGDLVIAPRPLPGVGADKLQGIGITPSGRLLYVASESDAAHVAVQAQDLASGTAQGGALSYKRDQSGDQVRGWAMINETQALVVESDGKSGASAAIKRVYLVDFSHVGSDGSVQKTLLADLMHLNDPAHLGIDPVFGDPNGQVGVNPFTYPFADVSGVYPSAPDTIVVVNNNHLPNNTGRKAKTAENTELIQIKLAAPLANLTLTLTQ